MNDVSSIEEYLDRFGSLTYTNVGVSMLPLLREGRDVFTLRKKGTERCKRGDVVLFRRPSGKYVLHRVIQVLPDSYVIMGDNCAEKETGIRDADILGVMTGFTRGGREHSVDETGYRVYSELRMRTAPVRSVLMKLRRRLVRLIKGIVS